MTNKEDCWSKGDKAVSDRHSLHNLNELDYMFNGTRRNKPWN
jgi:hypothetical protein